MEATIHNLDEQAYRALPGRAALQGRTIDDLINEAMRVYLARNPMGQGTSSLRDLKPETFPEGNERLSEEIGASVYGGRQP